MNQRSTKIVQLLSREKDEITVAGFAEYFDVSQKTIRNDLKDINDILEKNQKAQIVIKRGGVIIAPDNFKDSLPLLVEGNFIIINYQKKNVKKLHQQ